MKVLFSADWHIKLGQKNVPVEWQARRYRMLFDALHELERKVDLHIIGGDIFDKMPSITELELYFRYVKGAEVETLIYDGNHEATKRGHTFLWNLGSVTSTINEKVMILRGPVTINGIDYIPYTHLKNWEKETWDPAYKILCTHVRGNIPPHVKAEVNLEDFDVWDIVLAGDLHAYSNSQRNILYPGSPLSTSFHRNPIKNGVIIFDTDTLEHKWIDLKLPQLIRKTVESQDEAIPTEYDHTIYEIVGNISDLSGVDTNAEHIDKRVVKKNTETTLKLADKTIPEELYMYLQEVQKLTEVQLNKVMSTFNDYYVGE